MGGDATPWQRLSRAIAQRPSWAAFPSPRRNRKKDPLLPARDSGSVSPLAPLFPQNVVNERDASSAVSKASKWSFSAWETTQLAVYRDCMTAHDQVE